MGQSNSKPLESENDSLAHTCVFLLGRMSTTLLGLGAIKVRVMGLYAISCGTHLISIAFPPFCVMHDLELHYFSYQLGSFLKRNGGKKEMRKE